MKKTYIILGILLMIVIGFLIYMNMFWEGTIKLPMAKEEVSERIQLEEPKEKIEEVPVELEQPIEEVPVTSEVEANIVPKFVNGILLVNKQYPIPAGYTTGEDPEARQAFEGMKAAALEVGHALQAYSGFRTNEYQASLYQRYVDKEGEEAASRYSAKAGQSEHETGLAYDIGEVGREDLWLTEAFGESEAGIWLTENAHLYGFILRYPEGKESITGYMYESWHFRYLGVDVATQVYESGLTLEEFLNVIE